MRLIKFRVWHKEKKKWMNRVDWRKPWMFNINPKGEAVGIYNVREFDRRNPDAIQIVSVTENVEVSFFTEFYDMNGKEIYEGDLLRWHDWQQENIEEPDIYIISWKAPSFIWKCYRNERKLDTDEVIRDTNEFEVVDNIYENPELSQ